MTPTPLTSGATVSVPDATIRVEAKWDWSAPGTPTVDLTGLLLGADGRVGGDGDMVFYNHPRHASGAVRLHTGAGRLQVELPSVPANVTTVALAVSVDSGTFDAVKGLYLLVQELGHEPMLRFDPPDTAGLSALVLGELYRRGAGWKFRAVGQGWSDGLAGLARTYGIAVEPSAPVAPVAPSASSVEERLPDDIRERLSIRKRLVGEVLARQNAANLRARVFLVLDASGSLEHAYDNGTMARVVERLAAVGAHLTPDGVLAAWIFASNMTRLPDVTVADLPGWTRRYLRPGQIPNLADPVPMFRPDGTLDGAALGFGNEEWKVMKDVVRTVAELPPGPPVLVLFLSDGGVTSRTQQIESVLRKSADRPMFWQFVGVGGTGYGVLERLDRLTGRRVDNTGFFAVDDLDALTDTDLYTRLLSQFPTWVHAATRAGVIR